MRRLAGSSEVDAWRWGVMDSVVRCSPVTPWKAPDPPTTMWSFDTNPVSMIVPTYFPSGERICHTHCIMPPASRSAMGWPGWGLARYGMAAGPWEEYRPLAALPLTVLTSPTLTKVRNAVWTEVVAFGS